MSNDQYRGGGVRIGSEANSTDSPISQPAVLEGGCHCRRVRFRVTVRRPEVVICNCSICTMKGFRHVIVADADLTVLSGLSDMNSYSFQTGVAKHTFCGACGIHPFYVPRSHPSGYSVNANCLDEPNALEWTERPFDGQNWDTSISSL